MQTFSSKESKRDVLCKETDVYSLSPIDRRGMGYSWGIHRVFMGYSYVSVMYRLCIGYVSVTRRSIRVARGIYLSTIKKQFRFNNENNEDSTMETMIFNNGKNDNNNDDNNNNYALVTK